MNEVPMQLLHYNQPSFRETNIHVTINSGTPIVLKVPIDPNCMTLGEFKSIIPLQDGHHKFYFKSEDSEFGVVKEEVADDCSVLPVDGNTIVAWIITNDQNQSSLFNRNACSNELIHNQLPNSISNQAHSTTSFYSNSSQPIYQNDCHNYSQCRDIESVTVHLLLSEYNFLGITLVGSKDQMRQVDNGIYIGEISPGSVADLDGRFRIGDRIVEVNNIDLRNLRNDDAADLFKCYVDRRGILVLRLEREMESSLDKRGPSLQTRNFNNDPTDTTDSLPTYENLPIPEFGTEKRTRNQQEQKVSCDSHSLPRSITPRSLYTSNTLGNLTASSTLLLQLDSRSAYEPTTPTSIRDFHTTLHFARDDIHTIYAALKADAKCLDIKDREWLKVVVRDAFMGSVLIKWLSRNVYGFCNKRETKQYANKLLALGLIRSPMANSKFSEKCLYTLS